MTPPVVQLVSATRLEEAPFWNDTLLGRSLRQPQHRQLVARICFANRDPLAIPYNAAIEAAPAGAVLVFCHDDVDLGPEPLAPQLQAALARFDLVYARHRAARVIDAHPPRREPEKQPRRRRPQRLVAELRERPRAAEKHRQLRAAHETVLHEQTTARGEREHFAR